MDITHDNVCSSMLSCFYSHLLSTGRPISSCLTVIVLDKFRGGRELVPGRELVHHHYWL